MLEQKPELSTINLAAIPLDNRSGRRLLRDILKEYAVELEAARFAFAEDMSMDDYLIKVKAVKIVELRHMDKIDSLPDEEYVDAMVAFKKGLIKTYHDDAIEKGDTKANIYQWCLANFHEEFSQIGRRDAEMELAGELGVNVNLPPPPTVFVVAFDGTMVEDHYPSLGAESPFAFATVKALQANGHTVLIWHNRSDVEYRDMMTMLKMGDIVPNGTITHLPVGDLLIDAIVVEEGASPPANPTGTSELSIPVDYIIHNSSMNAARLAITGDESNVSFYWGDMVTQLMNDQYISQEDYTNIQQAIVSQDV